MKTFVLLATTSLIVTAALLTAGTHATPAVSASENMLPVVDHQQVEDDMLRKLSAKCRAERDHETCMRLKWYVNLSRIFKKSSISVTDNLNIALYRGAEEQALPFDYDEDRLLARSMDSEEDTYAVLLAGKLWKFIRSSTLRYKFSDNANFVVQTEPRGNLHLGVSISPSQLLAEGRGRIRGMMPMIMMLGTKAAIVGAVVLKALFLLAGKALIVSKIALLLSVIIALKKLMSQKQHIVEVPHHEAHPVGWSRALDGFIEGMAEEPARLMAQELVYSAHKPAQQAGH